MAFGSNLRKKLSRIEHVLILKVSFERRKIAISFHDTCKFSFKSHFRKLLSKENFPVCHYLKARIDNQKKKLVKQQWLFHMSSQYGELRPTNGWDWFTSVGTSANFSGFRVLAALLHVTPVVGVSQNLWRWTQGVTYIRQGDHEVRHWPTF